MAKTSKPLADAIDKAKPGDSVYWGVDPGYSPKQYAAQYEVQFRSKPKPPSREHSWIGNCDDPHCQVCKKPVKNEPHGGFCGDPTCKVCDDFMMLKKPVTGRHYSVVITDDLTDDAQMALCNYACRKCKHPTCAIRNRVKKDDSHKPSAPNCSCSFCRAIRRTKAKLSHKSKKEVNMCSEDNRSWENMNLYEVITTYGIDRNEVIVEKTHVVAENEERALMQCKDVIKSDWDLDYVSQSIDVLCSVRVKRKPRETKEVAK